MFGLYQFYLAKSILVQVTAFVWTNQFVSLFYLLFIDFCQLVQTLNIELTLMFMDFLEFILQAIKSLKDGEFFLAFEWTATAAQSVALLVQCTQVIQILLDFFAVSRIFVHSARW